MPRLRHPGREVSVERRPIPPGAFREAEVHAPRRIDLFRLCAEDHQLGSGPLEVGQQERATLRARRASSPGLTQRLPATR